MQMATIQMHEYDKQISRLFHDTLTYVFQLIELRIIEEVIKSPDQRVLHTRTDQNTSDCSYYCNWNNLIIHIINVQ